jgi:hypothetical protein
MTPSGSNFSVLDLRRPEIARLLIAMLQAREASSRRSWSHPQEPASEEWWADVLSDPRARRRRNPSGLYGRGGEVIVKRAYYTLGDENHETIFVACRKCEWQAAFIKDELIATYGRDYPMPDLLSRLAAPNCEKIRDRWDRCGVYYMEPLDGQRPRTPPTDAV